MTSLLSRGRTLAIVAPVFWSITGVTIRFMQEANEWQISFYRSGTMALFVLVALWVRYRGDTMMIIRRAGITSVVGGALVGMSMLCNIVALKHTTVANAALFTACGPVVAAILGRFLLGELVSRRTWAAIVLALAGISVMVGGGVAAGSLPGDAIALLGTVFFGVYVITLRRGADVDMTPSVFYGGLISALCAAAVSMTGTGLATRPLDIGLCIMLGVVQLGIGNFLFALASRYVPAAELTLYSLGEPVLSPLWTFLGVGEIPSVATLVGGGVILIALVLQASDAWRDWAAGR